jgi:flagellar basal body-associated protein FliL
MRRALKILLISGLFIMVVGGLGIYALVSKFNRDVVGIERKQAERYNEVERIKALPELQAIVVSAGTVRAPLLPRGRSGLRLDPSPVGGDERTSWR